MRLRNITLLCEYALFILILVHKGIRVESSVVVHYRVTPSVVLRAMEPKFRGCAVLHVQTSLKINALHHLSTILYIICEQGDVNITHMGVANTMVGCAWVSKCSV